MNPARLVRPRRENNAVIRYLLPEEERKLRIVANEMYRKRLIFPSGGWADVGLTMS
jgi:hypothetical protein